MKQKEPATSSLNNFRWQDHTALIVSAGVSLLVVLKIYAVAGWNPTTARGIIAENGTSNVIIGSLLASLPLLYWLLFILVLPPVLVKLGLNKRTSVEKVSTLTNTWPAILAVFILPAYLLITLLSVMLVLIVIKLVLNRRKLPLKQEDQVSRFESNSILVSTAGVILLATLSIPWLPTQSVKVVNNPPRTGYVLSKDNQQTTILSDEPRLLESIPSKSLESVQYCELSTSWLSHTIPQLFAEGPRYTACPNPRRTLIQ